MAARGDVERLADREQADRERRHLDAVEQFRNAEGKPRLAGELVDADQPERQADEQAGQPAHRRIAEGRRDGDEGDAHQREIILRPELHRDLDQPWREKGEAEGRDRAGDERADRGGRERRSAAAGLGHLVAFERGRHRGAFARRVDQDRGGRAAIHAAVIDAGEHDQRAAGIELVGDRQQQRDGERRPMPGSTPTAVPSSTPISANSRFIGCSATSHALGERGEGIHGVTSEQAFERARGQAQVSSLSNTGRSRCRARSRWRDRRGRRGARRRPTVAANSDRGRRDEAAAEADHARSAPQARRG